ncbi:MAG: hypothetical protein ACK5RL_03945 [Acidimicrobiales bacterium]
MAGEEIGLSRSQLDRHLRWRLKKAPQEPERLLAFVADLIASTIEANNRAIAAALAGGDELGDGEEY